MDVWTIHASWVVSNSLRKQTLKDTWNRIVWFCVLCLIAGSISHHFFIISSNLHSANRDGFGDPLYYFKAAYNMVTKMAQNNALKVEGKF